MTQQVVIDAQTGTVLDIEDLYIIEITEGNQETIEDGSDAARNELAREQGKHLLSLIAEPQSENTADKLAPADTVKNPHGTDDWMVEKALEEAFEDENIEEVFKEADEETTEPSLSEGFSFNDLTADNWTNYWEPLLARTADEFGINDETKPEQDKLEAKIAFYDYLLGEFAGTPAGMEDEDGFVDPEFSSAQADDIDHWNRQLAYNQSQLIALVKHQAQTLQALLEEADHDLIDYSDFLEQQGLGAAMDEYREAKHSDEEDN